MDNVPKETHAVSVMTHKTLATEDTVRDEKDDRLLRIPIRRQNRRTARDKNPHRDQAVNRKTRWTRVKFHANSSPVKHHHVSFGIFPCVKIIGLKKDVYMATNAISDMFRQKESPAKSQRRVVPKHQLLCWKSLYKRVVYLKILFRENLFHVNLENWDRNTPSNSPKALWYHIKIRERTGPSRGIIQKCPPHACAPKFEEISRDLHQEGCARKAAWELAKVLTSSRYRTLLLTEPTWA